MYGDPEGSYPDSKMYKDKEDARKELQTRIMYKNEEAKKEGWDNRFTERRIDNWTDGLDCLYLAEFDLI